MKSLCIICEGHTENEFVDLTLIPYFSGHGIQCYAFKITQSGGGLGNYNQYKQDVLKSVHDQNTIVSSLIDYYALPHSFPKYKDSLAIANVFDRLTFLESAIKDDILDKTGKQFTNLFPYIQVHEFEALLFSDIIGFEAMFEENQADFTELNNIIDEFPNPEEINNDPNTAPSKRLLRHIPRYNKVVDGNLILDEIGLSRVMQKCPRFNSWIQTLLSECSK